MLEPDGGNVYKPHVLMVHSGRFWRCAHGKTGLTGQLDWVGCEECAKADPEAFKAFTKRSEAKSESEQAA